MSEYTNEFFKLTIRSERVEEEEETVARYINGLSYAIQDELVIQHMTLVDEAYQLALRVEERLTCHSKKRPYHSYGHDGRGRQPRRVNRWLSGGWSVVTESLDQSVIDPRPTRGGKGPWKGGSGSFL